MTVRLKIRVKRADGARPYENPVYSPNGKLKPLFADIDGKAVHHPEGVYYLRYLKAGKRIWERVGNDPQHALTAKLKVEHMMQGVGLGMTAPELSSPALQKTNLPETVAEYLSDAASGKSNKTYLAYSRTLNTFLKVCSKQYVEEVNRRDVLNFIALLRDAGNGPRTVRPELSGVYPPVTKLAYSGVSSLRLQSVATVTPNGCPVRAVTMPDTPQLLSTARSGASA
jgi:hypothetical protein